MYDVYCCYLCKYIYICIYIPFHITLVLSKNKNDKIIIRFCTVIGYYLQLFNETDKKKQSTRCHIYEDIYEVYVANDYLM